MNPPAIMEHFDLGTQRGHAFLPPSGASRWGRCTASAWMEAQFPDTGDDTARREGVACHELMALAATRTPTAAVPLSAWNGQQASNGVLITPEMVGAVEMLLDDVAAKLGPTWREMITVEKPVAIPRIHQLCWGTPDLRAWAGSTLHVWDLKFGFGYVDAFENDQLTCYAAGAMSEAGLDGHTEQAVQCSLTIVQPRSYAPDGPIRTWLVAATDLRGRINQLAMAAEEATTAPTCKPQASECENCNARFACSALQSAAYRAMDIAQQPIPRVLTDDAMGLELALLTDAHKLIEARVSGLQEQVKARLSQGARVPHWAYGPGRGATKWTKSATEVQTFARMMGFDVAAPPDVITPIQAEAKGMPKAMVALYSQTIPGAVKLTRTDGNDVRKIFTQSK